MRWLMIVFLVSLGALLLAAAGVARHILAQRSRRHRKPVVNGGQIPGAAFDPAEDTDIEA
jgi:hypothetical protein